MDQIRRSFFKDFSPADWTTADANSLINYKWPNWPLCTPVCDAPTTCWPCLLQLWSGSKKWLISEHSSELCALQKAVAYFKYEAKQHHSLMRWTWFRSVKVIPINPCQHFISATIQPIKQSEQLQHSFKLQWLINIWCYLQFCNISFDNRVY